MGVFLLALGDVTRLRSFRRLFSALIDLVAVMQVQSNLTMRSPSTRTVACDMLHHVNVRS